MASPRAWVGLFPPPTLSERRHRGLAPSRVNYHREYFINDSDFKEKDFHLYDPSVQELVPLQVLFPDFTLLVSQYLFASPQEVRHKPRILLILVGLCL